MRQAAISQVCWKCQMENFSYQLLVHLYLIYHSLFQIMYEYSIEIHGGN